MAIQNTIKKTAIGLGDPQYYVAATTVAATNTQTNTLTASLTGTATTIGASVGRWRAEISVLTTATTVSSVTVTASNGTTTENVYVGGPWVTNSRPLNVIGEFITDLGVGTGVGYTNIVCTVVFGAAATGTIDFEWFGNP